MKTVSTESKMYKALLAHCSKQYVDIDTIQRAYSEGGKIFGIDYISKEGVSHIASGTAYADLVIQFKKPAN